MSKVTMKINLSPTKAGELYMKWSSLVKEVKAKDEEIKKLKFMIDEGLGWEDMQQDSMQSHIN
jgi:hypothetical protein